MTSATWRERASEIIWEAVRDLPVATPLTERRKIVDAARPHWGGASWPRKAWQSARRAYLVQYGYRPRTKAAAAQGSLLIFEAPAEQAAPSPLFDDPPLKEAAMRSTDIRMIHACARAAGFDEALRRAVYWRVTGRESLTEMTDVQVRKIAAEFRRLSPVEVAPRAAKGGAAKSASPKAHVRLVYALWWRLADAGLVAEGARGRAERRAALNAFINARFESHLNGLQTDVDFLSAALAGKVAEALKSIARRGGLELEKRG